MQPIKQIIRASFLILLVYGCTSQASSIEKNPVKTSTSKSGNELQSYVWYDGQKKRTVWLNKNLAADFHNDSVQTSQLKRTYPEASVRLNHRSVLIWQLPAQPLSDNTQLNRGKSSRPIPPGYSPVFHDNPTEAGRIRALPGNIIVYLNPDWNNEEITHWLETRSLEIAKKIEIRANAYILKTEPGMHALQIANTLYESGDVIAAFPDWWLESTTR
jgi:hypothetical protein